MQVVSYKRCLACIRLLSSLGGFRVVFEDAAYPIDRGDLSDRVYQALRGEILSGKLVPGQRLALEEFAQRFGISITPIRDAIRLLAGDGLVELYPRRGAFVFQPSSSLVEELFQIREILECAAVDCIVERGAETLPEIRALVERIASTRAGESHSDYLAYISLDERFHQLLIDSMGNRKLSEIYSGLRGHAVVTMAQYTAADHRASSTLQEHESIVAALEARDSEAAMAAVRAHLRNAKAETLQKLRAGVRLSN